MGRLGKSIIDDPSFVDDGLLPRRPGLDIGSAANPWANLFVDTVHAGSEAPDTDNTDDLGTLLFRYRHLYLGSQLYLANGATGAISARNVANAAFIDMLWLDATDDTVLNASTGNLVKIGINAAAILTVAAASLTSSVNLVFSVATQGVQLQSGANGRTGTFTMNGATPVVVSNSSLAAGDQIIITRDTPDGTPGAFNLTTRTNGTSFAVTGTASDTSGMRYTLVRIN